MADDICTVEETLATMTHLAFEASVSHTRSRGRSSYAGKWRVRLLPQGEHRLSQWLVLGASFTEAESRDRTFWVDGNQKTKAIEPAYACAPANVGQS